MKLDKIRAKIEEGKEVCVVHNGSRHRIDEVKVANKITMAHLYTDEVKSTVSACASQFQDGVHEGGRDALKRDMRASREILKHSMSLYCPNPGVDKDTGKVFNMDPEDPKGVEHAFALLGLDLDTGVVVRGVAEDEGDLVHPLFRQLHEYAQIRAKLQFLFASIKKILPHPTRPLYKTKWIEATTFQIWTGTGWETIQ